MITLVFVVVNFFSFCMLQNLKAQMSGDPTMGRNMIIQEDTLSYSSKRGTVTFAMSGKHTRTTQKKEGDAVDNKFLDKEKWSGGKLMGCYNKYGEGGKGDRNAIYEKNLHTVYDPINLQPSAQPHGTHHAIAATALQQIDT